jgi:hypothetical protein
MKEISGVIIKTSRCKNSGGSYRWEDEISHVKSEYPVLGEWEYIPDTNSIFGKRREYIVKKRVADMLAAGETYVSDGRWGDKVEILHICSAEFPAEYRIYDPSAGESERFSNLPTQTSWYWGESLANLRAREAAKAAEEEAAKAAREAAKPILWVCGGVVFSSWDDCQASEMFHPAEWQGATSVGQAAELAARQNQLLEEGGYGD